MMKRNMAYMFTSSKAKILLRYCIVAVIVTVVGACTKDLDFEVSEAPPILVVDGVVTDKKEIYTIRLNYASAFTGVRSPGGVSEPINGATVNVKDDLNNIFEFENADNGLYLSDTLVFIGQEGRTYTLHIETPDGKQYESLTEKLMTNGTFDTLSFIEDARRQVLSSEGRLVERQGVELRVSFTMEDRPDAHLRWSISYSEMDRTTTRQDITIFSRNEFNRNQVIGMPIDFIYDQGAYATTVQMYSLSPNAYNFWLLGQKQQNNGGTIFESSPIEVPGNIININDPDELVLGLFSAVGVSTETGFITVN